MKTYLKDLTPEEIIKRLKNGEIIENEEGDDTIIKYYDGVICRTYEDGSYEINVSFTTDAACVYYFETEEPFEIKETGLYKTRDGRKVFVSCITDGDIRPVKGIIQGEDVITSWFLSGEYEQCHKCDEDITSKLED